MVDNHQRTAGSRMLLRQGPSMRTTTATVQRLRSCVSGHLWTMRGPFDDALRPRRPPPGGSWSTIVHDRDVGPVKLHGTLHHRQGSRDLVIILHGLGGSSESFYVRRAARAAAAAERSSLRLNCRGADRSGEDFHHAGLTEDIRAVLASPSLANYERI